MRRKKQKSKKSKIKKMKKMKNQSFLGSFLSRGGGGQQIHLLKQNQFQLSQTAIPGPSVFEEDLEDLEDLHHHGDV